MFRIRSDYIRIQIPVYDGQKFKEFIIEKFFLSPKENMNILNFFFFYVFLPFSIRINKPS